MAAMWIPGITLRHRSRPCLFNETTDGNKDISNANNHQSVGPLGVAEKIFGFVLIRVYPCSSVVNKFFPLDGCGRYRWNTIRLF
jgi:hypothetical protein